MALDIRQIAARVESLKYRASERDARAGDVLAVRQGKIADVYPDFFPEGVDVNVVANPKLAIAGGSKGTVDHVFMGLLVEKAGGKATAMNYVPYAGGGEVTTSVLSGQTVAGVSGTSEFASFVKAGKLRVLALSSPKRLKSIKGQTLTAQGINWFLSMQIQLSHKTKSQ